MNHLIAHQTTLLQTETHILKGAFCLDCDGFLQVLVLSIPIFKRPKQNASVSIVANCPIFKTCFTNEHLLKQTYQIGNLHIGIQLKTFNPIEIENFINALNFQHLQSELNCINLNIIKALKPLLNSFKTLFQDLRTHTFWDSVPLCLPLINHFGDSGQC
jgi:hypothetical protein